MKNDPKRLWDRTERVGECLEWRGATAFGGYGLLMWNGERRRRAHRVAYELVKGPIPPGLHVLHRCDNPPCVNPEHLFLGTQNDNMRDMRSKNRASPPPPTPYQNGTANPMAKLTDREVIAIRHLAQVGTMQRDIANAFAVSHATISVIVSGKRWSHLLPAALGDDR